ncbi:MAG: RdgB/HAM1 family non-canonical purine NTP pyrophosphatase [Acidimicrobiia bacterium]
MSFPLPFVLATGNADKAREIVEVIVERADHPVVAWALTVGASTYGFLLDTSDGIANTVERTPTPAVAPDVTETGATLEENARIKALALAQAIGVLAIADDSGLEVDALDGAPGVRSARYAGEAGRAADNVAKLMRELDDSPSRDAVFATVALARWPDGREIAVRGEVKGAISERPRGEHGFGYDPVFVPVEGDGRTFGEMAMSEKNALSHRGRAFRALAEALDEQE